jgi:limonene-1,2-epoxide hydrolase
MSRSDAGTIARQCLEAWTSGDFATARSLLRDDVTSVGPLGANVGVEDYMAELEGLAEIVTGARQRRVMVDGADACIFYDLVTIPVGPLPSSSWYHVRDGKIDSVRDYFDARVLVQGDHARHGVAIGGPRSAVGREVTQFTFPVFLSAEMEIAESNDP